MTSTAPTVPIVPANGDQLVPLVTWVKAKDAPVIQAQIAQLLVRPEARSGDDYKPPHSSTFGPKDAWELLRWEADETSAATWILSNLGSNQRRVIALLIAKGAAGVWTGDLRRLAGYDDATTMSGVFKAISGRFRATGHRPVWNGGPKDSQRGQQLTVADDTARKLFAAALKTNHPETAEQCGVH